MQVSERIAISPSGDWPKERSCIEPCRIVSGMGMNVKAQVCTGHFPEPLPSPPSARTTWNHDVWKALAIPKSATTNYRMNPVRPELIASLYLGQRSC